MEMGTLWNFWNLLSSNTFFNVLLFWQVIWKQTLSKVDNFFKLALCKIDPIMWKKHCLGPVCAKIPYKSWSDWWTKKKLGEFCEFPGGCSLICWDNGVLASMIVNCTGLLFGIQPSDWPGDRSFYLTVHKQPLTNMPARGDHLMFENIWWSEFVFVQLSRTGDW